MRRTEEHISILPACYHYDNVNTPYRSSRSTTSHAKIFSSVQPYLYSVCYNQGCLCRSLQRLQEGQEKLPSHRKKPWPEPGSYERTPLLMNRGGGGGGETGRERRTEGGEGQTLQMIFTLAFRTVQWRELVALSYRRSNSSVPKEAANKVSFITTSATILYSITSTYTCMNSPPPHTQNCPLFCMDSSLFYCLKLKKMSRKKAENNSTLNIWFFFLSHYASMTDGTPTSVC